MFLNIHSLNIRSTLVSISRLFGSSDLNVFSNSSKLILPVAVIALKTISASDSGKVLMSVISLMKVSSSIYLPFVPTADLNRVNRLFYVE